MTTPKKRMKMLSSEMIFPIADVTEPLLHEAKMANLKGNMMLQIRANRAIYLYNKDDKEDMAIGMNEMIASFGKGSFKTLKGDEPIDAGVEYRIHDDDQLVAEMRWAHLGVMSCGRRVSEGLRMVLNHCDPWARHL